MIKKMSTSVDDFLEVLREKVAVSRDGLQEIFELFDANKDGYIS